MRFLKNFHAENVTVGDNRCHYAQNIKYSLCIFQKPLKNYPNMSSKIQYINMLYSMQ